MKPAPSTHTLADLRPNATIRCLRCGQQQPSAGAVKFHAHHVCAACATKLQSLQEKTK